MPSAAGKVEADEPDSEAALSPRHQNPPELLNETCWACRYLGLGSCLHLLLSVLHNL